MATRLRSVLHILLPIYYQCVNYFPSVLSVLQKRILVEEESKEAQGTQEEKLKSIR